MKSILFPILILLAACSAVFAQVQAVQRKPKTGIHITTNARAVVTVINGTQTVRVDLSEDIAGCAYIEAGQYKRDLEKRACAASPSSFDMIDATVKDGETFVVLFSQAAGGCNVCGRCGASSANSLIWVRLGKDFKFVDKKAVAVESCNDDVVLVEPLLDGGEEGDVGPKKTMFKFISGKLTAKYERSIYGDGEKFTYELSTLVYDKSNPGAGFVITKATSPDSILDNR